MSVNPLLTFPPTPEAQAAQAEVRTPQPQPQVFPPESGNAPGGKSKETPSTPVFAAISRDEVKLQWDNSDQVLIYQFLNQQGSLILQVPSQQLLNIGRGISQELEQEAKQAAAAAEGEKKS